MKKELKNQIDEELDDIVREIRIVVTDYVANNLDAFDVVKDFDEQSEAMDYIVQELRKCL